MHTPNTRLRLERLARGWEQDDVAAALEALCALLGEPEPRVDAGLVSKWERGVRTPGAYYTPRLCIVFHLPPERLGLRPGPRLASDCRRLSVALGQALGRRLGHVNRRDFVQHLLWGGAALATGSVVDAERIVAAASGQVDRRLLDDLHTIAAEHAKRMHTTPPPDLLPHVEHHLAYVQGLLRTPQPPAEQVRLHLVGGTMAAVAGRLSSVLGNPGNAHAHWVAAEGHALEAGDGPLRAFVLGQRTLLCSDLWGGGQQGGDPSTALALLDEAHAAAGTGSSPWLRTWLSARRAEERAARGDARATHQDLEQADHVLSTAESADIGFFAYWHAAPLAHLATYRGNCTQLLGHAREATTVMEDALGSVSPSLVAVRSYAMADLAMAYAKDEQVEHACEFLTQSLELSADAGLVAHFQRVVGVRRHLARWQDAPAVCELDDRLRCVTWAPV